MDFKVSIGDDAGAVVSGVAKFVSDVKSITGPGAQGGVGQGVQIVSAAIGDLSKIMVPNDAAKVQIKEKPVAFAVALVAGVVDALQL